MVIAFSHFAETQIHHLETPAASDYHGVINLGEGTFLKRGYTICTLYIHIYYKVIYIYVIHIFIIYHTDIYTYISIYIYVTETFCK